MGLVFRYFERSFYVNVNFSQSSIASKSSIGFMSHFKLVSNDLFSFIYLNNPSQKHLQYFYCLQYCLHNAYPQQSNIPFPPQMIDTLVFSIPKPKLNYQYIDLSHIHRRQRLSLHIDCPWLHINSITKFNYFRSLRTRLYNRMRSHAEQNNNLSHR